MVSFSHLQEAQQYYDHYDPQEPFKFKCECGNEWHEIGGDDLGLLKCDKCGRVQDIDIEGIGDLTKDQLGDEVGKYSYCSGCGELTLNIAGQGKNELACKECGNKKRIGGYACPACNYDSHAIIEMTPSRCNPYYSYEFGVTGYDWEELWKCLLCGEEYWIGNSTC